MGQQLPACSKQDFEDQAFSQRLSCLVPQTQWLSDVKKLSISLLSIDTVRAFAPDERRAQAIVRGVPYGLQPVVQQQRAAPGHLAAAQRADQLVQLLIVQPMSADLQNQEHSPQPGRQRG